MLTLHVLRRKLRGMLGEWLLLACLLAALTVLASQQNWLWRLDNTLYDMQLLSWRRAPPPDIVIIAVDDDSLSQIGRWPWRRALHAALLDRLRAAKAVGLDVLFTEPDADPKGDAALVRALGAHGRVVLPVGMQAFEGGVLEMPPLPAYRAAAAALGHVSLELDMDGIARSVYLREGLGAPRWPHFAVALLDLAEPGRWAELPGLRNPKPPTRHAATWTREHWLHIPFSGPPGHFQTLSYVSVLRGDVPPEFFRDKWVLVGATGMGMGDAYPTALSGQGRAMPGVEIHANILDALRNRIHIAPMSEPMRLALSLMLPLIPLAGYLRLRPRQALLLTGGMIALAFVGSLLLLRFAQLWFPPSVPIGVMLLAYPLWSWRRLEAAQRYLDEELERLDSEPEIFPAGAPLPGFARQTDPIGRRIEAVRSATQRLRNLRRFVSDSLAGLPDGALVVDRAGKILLANATALQYLQASAADSRRQLLSELLQPLKTGKPIRWENFIAEQRMIEARHPDGRDLLVHAVPFLSAQNEHLGSIVTLVDISPLKEAERKREQTLGFLGHDIRSPQSSIIALLDIHRMAPDTLPLPELMQGIENNARKTVALAEDFVQLARAETCDVSEFNSVDLSHVALGAAEEIWSQAHGKHIEIAREIDTGPALVKGDAVMLHRALVNLLSNAVKYSPEHTRVTFNLQRIDGMLHCCVADQGYGIAEQDLPRLFRPFERLSVPGQPQVHGIGLGLPFVQTTAEKHGGRVEVRSEVGKGTTFCLILPEQPEREQPGEI